MRLSFLLKHRERRCHGFGVPLNAAKYSAVIGTIQLANERFVAQHRAEQVHGTGVNAVGFELLSQLVKIHLEDNLFDVHAFQSPHQMT